MTRFNLLCQSLALFSVIAVSVSALVVSKNALAETQDVLTVIATRSPQPLTILQGSTTILEKPLLDSLGANHAEQLLRQVPGVNYQRGNGQESLPAIRSAVLTGAGACGNILVMEESIPVRGAGFCNVNELFDAHFEQAAQLEVARGSTTAFYGSNALLGAINVHLPAQAENRLALELGPNNYLRGKGSFTYTIGGEAEGALYLTLTEDDGYRDDSGYEQQKLSWRQSFEKRGWQGQLGLTAVNLDQETAGFIVGENAYLDESLSRQNLDTEAFRKLDSLRAWIKFEKEWEQSEISITSYLRDSEMDFRLHFLPGDPQEHNEQFGVGLQSALTIAVNKKLEWSSGLDIELARGSLLQFQDEVTVGSDFLRETIPTGVHYDYEVDALQAAVFTHLDWQLGDRWRLLIGGRLEHLRYDYNNLSLDGRTRDDGTVCGFGGCRYSRPGDQRDDFTHFSPKFELQVQPSQQWRARLSYSNSFRAPQATELYRLQRDQTTALLNEVEAHHFELGFNWKRGLDELSLALYYLTQNNVIIRDSDFFNVDGQRLRSFGIELSLVKAMSDSLSFNIAATYARHKYASDQFINGENINRNEVDTAPRWLINSTLSWQVNPRLTSEFEMQFVDSYFLEPNNLARYSGHTLWNWRTHYRLTETLSANVRLLNLTDRRYAERADFTNFSGHRYFPGEPRSLFFEMDWRF